MLDRQKDDPLVSIVIPVYNGERFLADAINCSLTQTYKNIEIIVVNDGSKDNSREIALSYGDKIRYFEKENGGVSTALNMAIKNMRGQYFSWLSHDDLYFPDKISAQIAALKDSGDMEQFCYCQTCYLNMETKQELYPSNVPYDKYYSETGFYAMIMGLVSHGCAALIPRVYFERYGLFDEKLRYWQDVKLFFDMLIGNKAVFVPKVLVKSRQHKQQNGQRHIAESYKERTAEIIKNADMFVERGSKQIGCDIYHTYGIFMLALYMPEFYSYIARKMKNLPETLDIDKKIDELKKALKLDKANDVVVYCCGRRGRKLAIALQLRGIKIKAFSDSNPQKWGQNVIGIECIPPKEINKMDLVIVSKMAPASIEKELSENGYKNIANYEDVLVPIIKTPIKKEILQTYSFDEDRNDVIKSYKVS